MASCRSWLTWDKSINFPQFFNFKGFNSQNIAATQCAEISATFFHFPYFFEAIHGNYISMRIERQKFLVGNFLPLFHLFCTFRLKYFTYIYLYPKVVKIVIPSTDYSNIPLNIMALWHFWQNFQHNPIHHFPHRNHWYHYWQALLY